MSKSAATRIVRPVILTALLFAAAWIAAREPAVHASLREQPATQSQVVGEGQNRAAVAVKFGDGRVETRCVAFPEDTIGGGDLLDRSGLALAISPDGAVCSISGEGCPTDDCFCLCQNFDNCQYWAFYQWQKGNWQYSQFGVMANSVVVRDGTLHGWSWGAGDASTGAPPPDVTYDQICSASRSSSAGAGTLTATSTAGSSSPLLPGSLQGGVPLAPTAEPSPLVTTSPQPTATLYQFSLPATETPRPRRVLGADSGPTPTPLLLARAPGVSGRAPAANAGNALASDASGNEPLLQSAAAARSFSPELLPEYAAYIVTVAALLVMAWYVLHRRNARAPTAATEPGEDGAGATRTAERE